jgi:hypothetical protein
VPASAGAVSSLPFPEKAVSEYFFPTINSPAAGWAHKKTGCGRDTSGSLEYPGEQSVFQRRWGLFVFNETIKNILKV